MQTEATYTRQAINRLLCPRSVAIVGASSTPGSFGSNVLINLERSGYRGELFLVNPKRSSIGGRPCVVSVDELPESIDCAVLAIPRVSVLETVQACARRKVGGVIIFAAGFAEAGTEGLAEQHKLREIAKLSGMIIEGPNCIGIVNYLSGTPLTFVTTDVKQDVGTDRIAVVSQSGAMAVVLGVSLRNRHLQISHSISTGNEAAIGVEDFVEYMIDENPARVLALIVEQFRQPKRFLRLVMQARAAGKFIVLLHPGRSNAARSSAQTHTGAIAGDYLVMKTKVEHAGVVLVDTLEEMVDVCDILLRCPTLPVGGAAVFTESGAFKALALDFCETIDLTLPPLSDVTASSLRSVLPDFIPPTNPLDLTAQGLTDPALYRRTLPLILADSQYGSVILAIILTDEGTSNLKFPPIVEAIHEIKPTKPVIFVAMDEGAKIDPRYVEQLRELGVPFFPSPERAFRAMARVTAFANRMSRVSPVRQKPQRKFALAPGVLPEYKSKEVLKALGVSIPAGALAVDIAGAQKIAFDIGFPVALKAQASALPHKSDFGGVALNLSNPSDLSTAWQEMYQTISQSHPDLVLEGLLVERMGTRGAEIIVGARNDPDWGPVLLIGMGGVLAEAMNDVRLLAPELSEKSIEEELHLLKSSALLRGFRGSAVLDVFAIAGIVARLGALMLDHPEIREVDINPVVAYPIGAIALDALIVVADAV